MAGVATLYGQAIERVLRGGGYANKRGRDALTLIFDFLHHPPPVQDNSREWEDKKTREAAVRPLLTWLLLEFKYKKLGRALEDEEPHKFLSLVSPLLWTTYAEEDYYSSSEDEIGRVVAAFIAALNAYSIQPRGTTTWRGELVPNEWHLSSELRLEGLGERWREAGTQLDLKAVVLLRLLNALRLRELLNTTGDVLKEADSRAEFHAIVRETCENKDPILNQCLLEWFHQAPLGCGLVVWKHVVRKKFPSLNLKSEPAQEECLSCPLRLTVNKTVIRHATNTATLLSMIKQARNDGELTIRGNRSDEQYTGPPLAWFGIDNHNEIDELKRMEQFKEELKSASENRYGCAVLRIPLSNLLGGCPGLWQLGERRYKSELSQTILVDPLQQGNWMIIHNSTSTQLTLINEGFDEDVLEWPYNYHFQTGHWAHPEFAVLGGLKLTPKSGLRISFEDHGPVCVPSLKDRPCDCQDWQPRTLPHHEGRQRFINLVKIEAEEATVIQFQQDWQAFRQEDWDVLKVAFSS